MKVMKTTSFALKNGLQVILVDTESFPTVSTLLLIGAGSRYETERNNGIAHFFEHMAFKGSKKYPTAHKISSLIDGIGGVFNAFTSKDHTGYYIKAPTKHFELSLDVIADMIMTSLLKETEIEKEKGVIVEEINMIADNPGRKLYDVYSQLLYSPHQLGMPITGTKETVRTFDRSTFLNYMNGHYRPNNAVFVIAGGLNHASHPKSDIYYRDLITKRFSSWKKKPVKVFEPFKTNQKQPNSLIFKKETEQIHFKLGWRGYSFIDDRQYALSVLSAIMGSGMSSRLFTQVREKRGLAYYIYSYVDDYHDTGSLMVGAGVRANKADFRNAVKLVIDEFVKVKDGKIRQAELVKVKELIKGNMLLSLEDTYMAANFYGGKLLLQGKIESPEEVVSKIDSVTLDEVIAIARDIVVADGLNLAAIGDLKDADVESVLKL